MASQLNALYSALLAGAIILGTRGAGGQNPPLRDLSVTQKPLAPLSATDAVVHKGLFTIAAVVTNSAGIPVSDLAPGDFTLLDNGQPAEIRTFSSSLTPPEPAPELIFVVDTVNLSPLQVKQTENAITHFLLRNNGHLEYPCRLYRLTLSGLFSSLRSSRDGSLLLRELQGTRSLWTVWRTDSGSRLSGLTPNRLSLRALGAIAIDQRDAPSRKVVVWIGPGWPVNGGEVGFDEATEFSTRLREARITLDNVNVWPNPGPSFNYHDYLDAPRSQKDMQPADMALQVIATHTGGLVLDSSGDLDRGIDRCAKDVRSFYTFTFNPPHTSQMDEYHSLLIQVDRVALTVRAPTGYYNEPVYFDNPSPGIEKVTVAQLEDLVHSRKDLLPRLENLELTERLSTPRLRALLRNVHNKQVSQPLTTDADLSIALAPPPDEIGDRPPPPLGEQRTILLHTLDNLRNVIPQLPDFYASRDTVHFKEPAERKNESWKMLHEDRTLHFASEGHATVLYRHGHEVVEKEKNIGKRRVLHGERARDLTAWGLFGPMLSYALTAATADSTSLAWKRWERSKDGDLAVFSYRGVGPNNGPVITYCCLAQGNGTTLYRSNADTYGEFAVNPKTGAIIRIEISADLNEERDPDVPLIRSQIMVEYGPEELRGETYICPQRSVEISRSRTERQLHEWGMAFIVYGYFETMIDDSTFGEYHKFGSEARILPGFEEIK